MAVSMGGPIETLLLVTNMLRAKIYISKLYLHTYMYMSVHKFIIE